MKYLVTIILLAASMHLNATRHYVNIKATGANDGTSWADAFTELSVPLINPAYAGDTFWVVNGTYTGHTTETFSFHLLPGTVLYGGFDGSETLLSQRNFSQFLTILAGTNTYVNGVVKTDSNISQKSRIDGFRITHVLTKGSQSIIYGMAVNGSLILENCLVTNLAAPRIVEMSNVGNLPTQYNFINCQFLNNEFNASFYSGGATASGAIVCWGASVYVNITDCVFRNNLGSQGGAVVVGRNAQASLNRCLFYGNQSLASGGAIYDTLGGSFRAFNCLFVGNKAIRGSAHYAADTLGKHTFVHCTIADNQGVAGWPNNYAIHLKGLHDTLRNCILWGDSSGTSPEVQSPRGFSWFSNNIIKGGGSLFGTSGTMVFDPLFKSRGTALNAPFVDTSHFDYHLSAFSTAIDTGANLGLLSPFNLDFDNNARNQGRSPDLGAYEWKSCNWINAKITASGPLNFCQPDSVKLTASANPQYSYAFKWAHDTTAWVTITAKTTGTYSVVVVDSTGCLSKASVNVNAVATPSPLISRSGNTMSVPSIYATYQWYRSGTPIAGATSSSYKGNIAGQYTVQVTTTIAGCPGVSAAFNFTPVGVNAVSANVSLDIYPNPSEGKINLKLDSHRGSNRLRILLCNLTGAEVWFNEFNHVAEHFETSIDLSKLAAGVYTMNIEGDDFREVRKLVLR